MRNMKWVIDSIKKVLRTARPSSPPGRESIREPDRALVDVKEFLDKNDRVVTDPENAVGYRIASKDADGKLHGPVTQYDTLHRKTLSGAYAAGNREGLFEQYHPGGQLASRQEYRDDQPVGPYERWYESGARREVGVYSGATASGRPWRGDEGYRMESFWDADGVQRVTNGAGERYEEHENGRVSWKGTYWNGVRQGEWSFYEADGRLTNTEQYVQGRLVKGWYFDAQGDTFRYSADTYEVLPEFPGGMPALNQFLMRNIKYPKVAIFKGISGTVFVGFDIRANGWVSNVRVLQGIQKDCDAEAVRVVAMMPPWQAGRQQGRPVSVRYSLPIRFVIQ